MVKVVGKVDSYCMAEVVLGHKVQMDLASVAVMVHVLEAGVEEVEGVEPL